MKYISQSGRLLLTLLTALTLAPVGAYAHDTEPVARTKPVIDHAQPHKKVARSEHEHHASQHRQHVHVHVHKQTQR